MTLLIWTLLGITAALGIAGLWLGLRGRRIDDHPICRACRFDLVGVYHAPGVARLSEPCAEYEEKHAIDGTEDGGTEHEGGAGVPPVDHCGAEPESLPAPRCPECGRDLTRAKAVRIGARKKRPAFLTAGALMLLVTLSGVGAWGWGKASAFNWNTIKPTWLLGMEAAGLNDAAAEAALEELLSRASAGGLSEETLRSLIEQGLEFQADIDRRWLPQWGDLIEWSYKAKLVTEADFEHYARSAVQVWLPNDASTIPAEYAWSAERHEPRIYYEGERIGLLFAFGGRGASATDLFARPVIEEIAIDGSPIKTAQAFHQHFGLVSGSGFSSTNYKILDPLRAGEHEVVSTWRVHVFRDQIPRSGSWSTATAARSPDGESKELPIGFLNRETSPVTEFRIERRGRFTVDPARTPHEVRLVRDPALREIVAGAISLSFSEMRRDKENIQFTITRSVKPLSVAISFELIVRDGDREWPSISLRAKAGAGIDPESVGIFDKIENFDITSNRVDLILRPNPSGVALEDGFEAIWGEEIILRDIPIEWADELAPPTNQKGANEDDEP